MGCRKAETFYVFPYYKTLLDCLYFCHSPVLDWKLKPFLCFFLYYRTLWDKHIRLRHYLSKISHRFRIFLLLQFLVVTVSQFTTFFQTTAYSGRITYINGGDFAVSRALVSSLVSCYTVMLKAWDGYVFRSLRWSMLLGLFYVCTQQRRYLIELKR